jgi:hypothetical protein
MPLDQLPALKNYRNTSVMHSSNPYASVAVMGKMSARAQELGPYFRLKTTEAGPVSNAPAGKFEGRSSDVAVDFKRDWTEFMGTYADSAKVKFDSSGQFADVIMRHLNTVRRLPAPRPRPIYESRELVIPEEHSADYQALKELIQTGANLRPYLARDLQDEGKLLRPDKLLNAWGIHHLHFRATSSDLILLCKITDDAVFMIQAANHFGPAGLELWVNPELLRIVHENCPAELAECRIRIDSATPPLQDRIVVRRNNANFTATMSDGTTYFTRLTATGHCIEDWIHCRNIIAELGVFEKFVRDNSREFRAGLNWQDAEPLTIRMQFDRRDCYLLEPTKRIGIHPSS